MNKQKALNHFLRNSDQNRQLPTAEQRAWSLALVQCLVRCLAFLPRHHHHHRWYSAEPSRLLQCWTAVQVEWQRGRRGQVAECSDPSAAHWPSVELVDRPVHHLAANNTRNNTNLTAHLQQLVQLILHFISTIKTQSSVNTTSISE